MNIREYHKERCRNLPDFDSIDREFGISEIEEGNFVKKITDKVVDKINGFRKLLEEYLQSDGSNIAVLVEIKEMNDNDKQIINSLYKELMIIEREKLLVELEGTEKDFLDFIKKTLDKWEGIKPRMLELLKKAKESWNKEVNVKEELGYLG